MCTIVVITPRCACAARVQVIALGLDYIVYIVLAKKI